MIEELGAYRDYWAGVGGDSKVIVEGCEWE